MASYHVSVPHRLGHEAALIRLREFLEVVQRDYAEQISDVEGAWIGRRLQFRLLASGIPLSGTLVVEEAEVQVSGSLPLVASIFRGRIEQTIRQELEKLLS